MIFCGDLNVAHTEIDLANPKANVHNHGFTTEERAGFSAFVNAGFLDTFREFEKGGGHYTWWSQMGGARSRNVGWRIDYFLISKSLRPRLKRAFIQPDVMGWTIVRLASNLGEKIFDDLARQRFKSDLQFIMANIAIALMKILLVSPQTPDTFWSFKHAVRFVSRKASMAPLGLLTVAAMLPPEWELKLVDLNVRRLKDEDLRWADYVMLGAMIVQKESVREIVARCAALKKTVIAGGPLFTTGHEAFPGNPALRSGRGRGTDAAGRGRHAERPVATHLSRHGPAGHHPDAGAALGPHQFPALRDDVRAILARLPVRLRILRHHRDERARAPHENAGAIDCRTGRAVPARMEGHGLHRGRQFHRQQTADQGAAARIDRMAAAHADPASDFSPRRP